MAGVLNIDRRGERAALCGCYRGGVVSKTTAVSASSPACTIQLCTSYTVTSLEATYVGSIARRVFSCKLPLALLAEWSGSSMPRDTAVKRGWNGYRNIKSQRRKLTLEKKILPPLLPVLEPATFRSRLRRSTHWAIAAKLLGRYVRYTHLALINCLCYFTFLVEHNHCVVRCLEAGIFAPPPHKDPTPPTKQTNKTKTN